MLLGSGKTRRYINIPVCVGPHTSDDSTCPTATRPRWLSHRWTRWPTSISQASPRSGLAFGARHTLPLWHAPLRSSGRSAHTPTREQPSHAWVWRTSDLCLGYLGRSCARPRTESPAAALSRHAVGVAAHRARVRAQTVSLSCSFALSARLRRPFSRHGGCGMRRPVRPSASRVRRPWGVPPIANSGVPSWAAILANAASVSRQAGRREDAGAIRPGPADRSQPR